MAGLFNFLPKGTLNTKHLGRSPLMLRMMVLGSVMMCSIYMSSVCLKHTVIYIKPQSIKTKPLETYSYDSRIVGSNQRKVQGNPDLMITRPVKEHSNDPVIHDLNQMKSQINQEFPVKQRSRNSYDPGILDLEQPTAQNQELSRTQAKEENNSYDPIIVDMEKQRTQENSESARTAIEDKQSYESSTVVLELPPVNEKPEFASTKPIEGEHSFDHNIIGLMQADVQTKSEMASKDLAVPHSRDSGLISSNQSSKIQKKTEPIMIKLVELYSYDHTIAGLKQTKVPVKPQLTRTVSTDQHRYDPKITGLKERKIQFKPEFGRTNVTQPSCPGPGIAQSEIPYIHYPVPTSYSRRECACTPVRFFVIISMQRSGSKWLESLLNSHVNISSNGEIFLVKERRDNLSAITSSLDKVYNLDWRYSTNKKACMAAVGFKWMLNQGILNQEEVYKYFEHRGVLVIFLFRRNLLRRMISLVANAKDHRQMNGTHKAHVSTQQEAEILASYKPKLSAKSLVSRLKDASKRSTEAVEHFKSIRHMVLYYEDLVQNTTLKMSEVLEFLRVPQRRLSSNEVKIHTRPLSEMISNWNAVQRVLKRTQFASFLTSD